MHTPPPPKLLFLYLCAFSRTGGIEKFNRAFIKALAEIADSRQIGLQVNSVYDTSPDPRYLGNHPFKGFDTRKWQAILGSLPDIARADIIILGHVNLAPVGIAIKTFFPGKKLMVIAHGKEIWEGVSGSKRALLQRADTVLAVSNFTKSKVHELYGVDPARIAVFPNTLDPLLRLPSVFEKPAYLQQRYGLDGDQPVVLTIARLAHYEKYKGYDKVIQALPALCAQVPGTRYILAGKYNEQEFERLQQLIKNNRLEDTVIMPGFIKDEELLDHYLLADVFIMPSAKEGFGIVFIEALACGLPVIAGNRDGSVDAVKNGELGLLVSPDSMEEIGQALLKVLGGSQQRLAPAFLQKRVLDEFGFNSFRQRLANELLRQ